MALGVSIGATELVQNASRGCERHDKKPVDRFGPEESCQGKGRIGCSPEWKNFKKKDLRYSGTEQHNLQGKPLKEQSPPHRAFVAGDCQ